MIILSFILYILFSLFLYISCIGRVHLARFIQVFYLVTFSANIILFLLLSLFGIIDRPLAYLILQLLLCLLPAVFIRRKYRLTFTQYRDALKIKVERLGFVNIGLIVLIGLVLAGFFAVGITTPPNNLDSLDPTHLTKLFYWLQDGRIDTFTRFNLSDLFDPIFVHIQGLWLYVLGRSENLFFLVQWSSLVITVVTVYKIARDLQFSRTGALMSALIGLSFPALILQTYSFQGDLTVSALILLCISFALAYLLRKEKGDLLWAVLSLVLALGSKKGAYLVLPAVVIFGVIWLMRRIRNRKLAYAVAALLVVIGVGGGLLLGRALTGGDVKIGGTKLLADSYESLDEVGEKARYTFPRYLYQFISLDGLPRVTQNSLQIIKAQVFQGFYKSQGVDLEQEVYLQPGYNKGEAFRYLSPSHLHEDSAWFGPLAFILLPLSLVIALFSKRKERRVYAAFVLLLVVTYTLLVFLQRPGWDPYQGRYFMTALLPIVPLISILFVDQKVIRGILMTVIIPLSFFLSMNTLLTNESKPIVTARTLWEVQQKYALTIPENNGLQSFVKKKFTNLITHFADHALERKSIYDFPYWAQVYLSDSENVANILVDDFVPKDEAIFHNIRKTSLEFGLFGMKKDRQVIKVRDVSEVEAGYFLTRDQLDPLLIEGIEFIGMTNGYWVYQISN